MLQSERGFAVERYSTCAGMDVHAGSITRQTFFVKTGEAKTRIFINCSTATEIAEWLRASRNLFTLLARVTARPSNSVEVFVCGP